MRAADPPVPPAEPPVAPAVALRQEVPTTAAGAEPPGPPPPPKTTPASAEARVTEAGALSTAALQRFLEDDHAKARLLVERALALDPRNKKALELEKILRVLG